MISLDEAQRRTLDLAPILPREQVPLGAALGRWVADDVEALRTQPARALSAMDGYAVRHADLPGPWRVTGTSAAGGVVPPPIGASEAARIFTGARCPMAQIL